MSAVIFHTLKDFLEIFQLHASAHMQNQALDIASRPWNTNMDVYF